MILALLHLRSFKGIEVNKTLCSRENQNDLALLTPAMFLDVLWWSLFKGKSADTHTHTAEIQKALMSLLSAVYRYAHSFSF